MLPLHLPSAVTNVVIDLTFGQKLNAIYVIFILSVLLVVISLLDLVHE